MAAYGWGTNRPVEDWLFDEGYRFEFYQAMRLLGMRQPPFARDAAGPESTAKVVRLRSSIELSFPPSDVAKIKRPEKRGELPEMTVNVLGVSGGGGPLPTSFAQVIYDRARRGDTALQEFLDLFNHRLALLLYQGRESRRIGVEVSPPATHRAARFLSSVLGIGTDGMRDRLPLPDDSALRFAGMLTRRPVSMASLEALISGVFSTPVVGRAMQGAWHSLEEEQLTRIGVRGQNNRLGESVVLGRRVWDQQAAFELELGPLTWEQFQDFQPGNPGYSSLVELTRFAAGPQLRFNLSLQIKGSDVPPASLGTKGGSRLGYNTWLRGKTSPPPSEVRSITIPSRLTSQPQTEAT